RAAGANKVAGRSPTSVAADERSSDGTRHHRALLLDRGTSHHGVGGSACRVASNAAHKSAFAARRSAIIRSVNVCGPASPLSISSQVHGADTGAPIFGR